MAAAIVTATALLTGCSGATGEHPLASPSPPKTPKATAPAGLGTVDSVIASPHGDAWWLSTWTHYVGWGESAKRFDPDVTFVSVYDTTSHRLRHVVTTHDGFSVMWMRGAADTVVYLTTRPYHGNEDLADWRIEAVDLITGQRTTIDRADSAAARRFLPSLSISYPWAVYEKAGVYARNLLTGQRRTLLRSPSPGRVQAVGDQVFYLQPTRTGRDVFSVPLAGGPAVRVTHSGKVGDYTAGADGVAYYEPIDGDATSVWFQPAGATTARLLNNTEGSNLAVGDGFAAWISQDDEVFVRGTTLGAAAAVSIGSHWSPPARIAATGDRLVFSELTLDSQNTPIAEHIHLVRITPR
jgi:hypothetical protein